jgi:hypothetical protein
LRKAKFKMVSKLQHPPTFWFWSDFRLEKAFPSLEHRHCRGWRGGTRRSRLRVKGTTIGTARQRHHCTPVKLSVVRSNSAARPRHHPASGAERSPIQHGSRPASGRRRQLPCDGRGRWSRSASAGGRFRVTRLDLGIAEPEAADARASPSHRSPWLRSSCALSRA